MCQARCHSCTQKWLFSYALALEKASRVLYGGCSCQFLPCLVIIKGGNYPERQLSSCVPLVCLLLQDPHTACVACAEYTHHARLLVHSPQPCCDTPRKLGLTSVFAVGWMFMLLSCYCRPVTAVYCWYCLICCWKSSRQSKRITAGSSLVWMRKWSFFHPDLSCSLSIGTHIDLRDKNIIKTLAFVL